MLPLQVVRSLQLIWRDLLTNIPNQHLIDGLVDCLDLRK